MQYYIDLINELNELGCNITYIKQSWRTLIINPASSPMYDCFPATSTLWCDDPYPHGALVLDICLHKHDPFKDSVEWIYFNYIKSSYQALD